MPSSIPPTVLALAATLSAITPCLAGRGPENLFLLVNQNSKDSIAVADHYADLRMIPQKNIYRMNYSGSKVQITSNEFRDKILTPAISEIKKRKLGRQIDYIVYSCDFPIAVKFHDDFLSQKFPPHLKPTASITGATYLARMVQRKDIRMFLPEANDYAAVSNQSNWEESLAFHARINWRKNLADRDQTLRSHYLLSAMLGVTYGRGNTVEEIKSYLERAAKADGTKPSGTIYFIKNSTPRSTPRHDQFARARKLLAQEGISAEIHAGKAVSGWPDILGLTSGHSQLKLTDSGCHFLPGAIGDNITSHGARFTRAKHGGDHTCISEFLRLGAAGACGTIAEPTNLPHKFPNASLHVHYARGCSLAEAFYQSVLCPYQQLLVGDPLCQPWAKP